MEPFHIFVASSTEGEPIAKELRLRLQAELDTKALVELWRDKFPPGQVAVESLETVAHETDLAVIVMTPDDISLSRHKKKMAPRDNIVFELGLFIGALGRERSIVVREHGDKLKIPSDYLGVNVLTYDAVDLEVSLHKECVRLARVIEKIGLRPKWPTGTQASLAANADFYRQIAGAWWERTNHPEGSALSFFTITTDPLTGTVVLEGMSHDKDGEPCAKWRSEMTRMYPADRRIAYLWRGKHPLPGYAHLDFHGYGTMEFLPADDLTSQFMQGGGDFWDVNEAQPNDTVVKPVELRRVLEERHKRIMTSGSAKKMHDLVLTVLGAW